MTVMAISLLIMIISGTALLWPYRGTSERSDRVRRGIFCAICGLIFILVSGLRHYTIGADTEIYMCGYFREVSVLSPEGVLEFFAKYLTRHERSGPLFIVLIKIFQLFSMSEQGYLVYAAVLITVPFCVWIYKYSEDPLLSFVLIFTLFFSTFWLTGQKQAIAMAVIWVFAYPFLKRKKPVPFVLVCLVAALIHASALLFLPVYLLRLIPLKRRNFAMAAGAFALIMVAKEWIYPVMIRLAGYEWYDPYSQGKPIRFTLMYLCIAAFLCWRVPAMTQEYNQERIWVNCILLGLMAIPAVYIQNAAIRLVYIYEFPIVLALPAAISGMKLRNRMIFRYAIILALCAVFLKGAPEYLFFWQGEPIW